MAKLKTPEEIEKYWTDISAKHLVGKKIVEVRYIDKKEQEAWHWHNRALIIIFDDGSWMMPMSDDEGNDAGALATPFSKLLTIPVI
tara:strand:- start:1654 stop:1911 length:258 start_codon:yes stop_codon:yes gene_type:complete